MSTQKKQTLTNSVVAIGLVGLMIIMGLVLGNGYFVQTNQEGEANPESLKEETVTPDLSSDLFVSPLETLTAIPPTHHPDFVPRTATPYPGEIRSPVPPPPTRTPLPISKVTNLAEGLPDEEIYVVIVRHADGIYEQYMLPRLKLREISVNNFLNLNQDDTIVKSYGLIPIQHPYPPPTFTLQFSKLEKDN